MAETLPSERAVEDPLEHELGLVCEAISLVAGASARRVVVAGLRFGFDVAARSRATAAREGVQVRVLPNGDGSGAVAIERSLKDGSGDG